MSAPEPEQAPDIPVTDLGSSESSEELATESSTLAPVPDDAWYRHLPAEYHAQDYVRGHENLESFVRDSVNAQRMIGRKGIIQPTEDATIEDWGEYYKQLGRPEGQESYDASKWEDVAKDEIPRDPEFETAMMKELYDAGLSETQAKRLWNFYVEGTANQFHATMSKHNDLSQSLDERLTETYGQDRDVKLSYARKAWSELGGQIGASSDEWLGFLEQPMANGQRLGDQWPLIQAFVALGERTQESHI